MDEYSSPNYTEYIYEKKATWRLKVGKALLILSYVIFILLYFFVCYLTRLIPLFALCPLFTWMLVYFTWRLVSYDVYYTFNHGDMEFGKLRVKRGKRLRKACINIRIKCVRLICLNNSNAKEGIILRKTYDFSSVSNTTSQLILIYEQADVPYAIIFEATPKLISLLKIFVDSDKLAIE